LPSDNKELASKALTETPTQVMKLLGKGGSSRVYEAIDAAEKCVVAIKRVDLSDVDEAQAAGLYIYFA
jgi:hypothetical protein